jgi:hypothetical protein
MNNGTNKTHGARFRAANASLKISTILGGVVGLVTVILL